jgi:hypothetical protein
MAGVQFFKKRRHFASAEQEGFRLFYEHHIAAAHFYEGNTRNFLIYLLADYELYIWPIILLFFGL